MSLQARDAIIRLKKQNKTKNIQPNQKSGSFLKGKNSLEGSANPKNMKDHKRQLKCMIAELFPWFRETS